MPKLLHFEVIGRLWSAHTGCYQYTAALKGPEPSRRAARATRDAIVNGTAKAYRGAEGAVICGEPLPPIPDMGDFSEIIDCRIVLASTEYERAGRLMRRIDESRTLAGWRDKGSARTYARATYGA